MNLSRDFARQHDEAIMNAVAEVLDLGTLTPRDKLLMQRKISDHGLGLRSMEANLGFLFLAGFMKTVKSITTAFPNFLPTLLSTSQAMVVNLPMRWRCYGRHTAKSSWIFCRKVLTM